MPSPRGLTLPGPARELWLQTRDVIRRAMEELGGGTEYKLGGGTVLAARWRHRMSFDIDIHVAKTTALEELGTDRYRWLHEDLEQLGAIPTYSPELNFLNIQLGEGGEQREIQLWGHDLPLAKGHRQEPVEGRLETVLSNAQILRGKLERTSKKLSRDVYDVRRARELDPTELEIAVGTMRRAEINAIMVDWITGRERIADNAREKLRGVSHKQDPSYARLGVDGATALMDSRYERFRIGVEQDLIVVEAMTEGKDPRRMTMAADEAEHQFSALGINQHLRGKGPGADAIREYAVQLCRGNADGVLVFEERNDEATRWRTGSRSLNLGIIILERSGTLDRDAGGWRRDRADWTH